MRSPPENPPSHARTRVIPIRRALRKYAIAAIAANCIENNPTNNSITGKEIQPLQLPVLEEMATGRPKPVTNVAKAPPCRRFRSASPHQRDSHPELVGRPEVSESVLQATRPRGRSGKSPHATISPAMYAANPIAPAHDTNPGAISSTKHPIATKANPDASSNPPPQHSPAFVEVVCDRRAHTVPPQSPTPTKVTDIHPSMGFRLTVPAASSNISVTSSALKIARTSTSKHRRLTILTRRTDLCSLNRTDRNTAANHPWPARNANDSAIQAAASVDMLCTPHDSGSQCHTQKYTTGTADSDKLRIPLAKSSPHGCAKNTAKQLKALPAAAYCGMISDRLAHPSPKWRLTHSFSRRQNRESLRCTAWRANPLVYHVADHRTDAAF